MRFKSLPFVVVISLILCSFVWAEGAPPALQKISDHVYAYVDTKNASPADSYGANAGLVVGNDSALVIDTLISAKNADRFLADIRKVTDKPVKYVINTHHHLDHAWGNCVFTKLGAAVIAQENAGAHLPEDALALSHPEQHGLTPKDMEGTTQQGPTTTFKDSMKIDLGGVTVELSYPGPTHTNDSIIAYVPEDKVMFLGDMLFTHYHPFLAEGDLPNWQKTLDEIAAAPAAKIIPGHGPVSSAADLKDMKEYLSVFDAKAQSLCVGKTADDAPAIAQELIKLLPEQGRAELPMLVEFTLKLKYLPKPEAKK